MKTKEQVYVKINSPKEAKDAKRILKALGEEVYSSYYVNNYLSEQDHLIFRKQQQWVCVGDISDDGIKTEVTLKELIQIIANENTKTEDKPKSILDGKVAIQVNNEREFKLLMEHYENKGWSTSNYRYYEFNKFSEYKDNFHFMTTELYVTDNGYTIVPFEDFAKEVDIEVPKFIMKSEDGVDLYIGDKFYHIKLTTNGWAMNTLLNYDDNAFTINKEFNHLVKIMPQFNKAFSTRQSAEQFIKENALKWIEEQNKPKEIEVPLYFMNQTATVTANCEVHISDTRDITYAKLSHGDIHDIQNAINKLK